MIEGWIPEELPVSEHLRSVAEILAEQPTSREERDAERAERAEEQAKHARAQDAADIAATAAFRARMNGTPPRNVLAQAAAEPFRDREALARRRAAIEVLRPLGLADVITGGASGVIMDVNMGVLEAPADERARAAMDRQYAFERSEREARERSQYIADLKTSLRSRGLFGPRVSSRSAVPDDAAKRRYEQACREIGCPVDGAGRASLGTDYFGRPVTREQLSYR